MLILGADDAMIGELERANSWFLALRVSESYVAIAMLLFGWKNRAQMTRRSWGDLTKKGARKHYAQTFREETRAKFRLVELCNAWNGTFVENNVH